MTEEEIKDEIRRIVKSYIEIAFNENPNIKEEEKDFIKNEDLLFGVIEDVTEDYWESFFENYDGIVTKEIIAKVIEDDKIDSDIEDDEIGGPLDIF